MTGEVLRAFLHTLGLRPERRRQRRQSIKRFVEDADARTIRELDDIADEAEATTTMYRRHCRKS